MHTPWIERCTVQRVSLRDGLVLDLDDYNELVIATPIRLTLPPIGSSYPEEQVLIDPGNVSVQQRPLLDLAGAVCTGAWCDEGGGCTWVFPAGIASMSPPRRPRPPGSSTANATATWHACPAGGCGWCATTCPTTNLRTPQVNSPPTAPSRNHGPKGRRGPSDPRVGLLVS